MRRAPVRRHPRPELVQWLSDNGSAYTAVETVDFATALNLVTCFTPIRSPESNSKCKTFVKTIKRDYVRMNPGPDALSVLQHIPAGVEDYKAASRVSLVHENSRRNALEHTRWGTGTQGAEAWERRGIAHRNTRGLVRERAMERKCGVGKTRSGARRFCKPVAGHRSAVPPGYRRGAAMAP
jgi:transposase InsO family protein